MPAMITFLEAKFIITHASELVPSTAGLHSKLGALFIFQSCFSLGLNSSGLTKIS